MMLSLETVKKHVRSDDFADDDEYLQILKIGRAHV